MAASGPSRGHARLRVGDIQQSDSLLLGVRPGLSRLAHCLLSLVPTRSRVLALGIQVRGGEHSVGERRLKSRGLKYTPCPLSVRHAMVYQPLSTALVGSRWGWS